MITIIDTIFSLFSLLLPLSSLFYNFFINNIIGDDITWLSNEYSATLTLRLVLQIPDMIVQAIWKLARQHGPTANIFVYQIIIINSSINFIIYAISSSVFRNRLRKVKQLPYVMWPKTCELFQLLLKSASISCPLGLGPWALHSN